MTFDTYREKRLGMVASQIQGRGVSDECVLRVMRDVPRHRFVPAKLQDRAYEDYPLAIGCGQTISQPYMVALMTELLELTPEDRVLEIGTGSAYQTAILASLAGVVVSIERQAKLVQQARRLLYELDYGNVTVILGDGTLGCPECMPFDAIVVTAGSPEVPHSLQDQLGPGGRLVCPVGSREAQKIVKVLRTPLGLHKEKGIGCVFVPLIGAEGWGQ